MCEPITERRITLNRALTAVEDALTQFADYDTYDRVKWTPVESLSEKPLSCTIATAGQLRAFLKPALQLSAIHVTHSTCAPYRSILGYADSTRTDHHIVIAQETIKEFGSSKHCAISHRLAYYLATALGSSHTPAFAINSFDASMAAYIKCRVQDPQIENCSDIFSYFLIPKKTLSPQVTDLMVWCKDRIKLDQPPMRSQMNCMNVLWRGAEAIRDLILQGVENHSDLAKERRSTLQNEVQKIPMLRKEIKTIQEALDGYADITKTISALFQTTAGRYYFWALRTQLFYSCKEVTDPARRAATPNIATLECQYRGFTARRNFEVKSQQSTDELSQK